MGYNKNSTETIRELLDKAIDLVEGEEYVIDTGSTPDAARLRWRLYSERNLLKAFDAKLAESIRFSQSGSMVTIKKVRYV